MIFVYKKIGLTKKYKNMETEIIELEKTKNEGNKVFSKLYYDKKWVELANFVLYEDALEYVKIIREQHKNVKYMIYSDGIKKNYFPNLENIDTIDFSLLEKIRK